MNVVLSDQGEMTVEVVDMNGSLVALESEYNTVQFNTSLWEAGVYLVIIQSGDQVAWKKVVKM